MIVTGVTTTRLNELKKYKVTDVFEEKYLMNGSPTNNGVVSGSIIEGEVIYYINGVKYRDVYDNDVVQTFFEYKLTPTDEENKNLVKKNQIGFSIDYPNIKKDVYIDRGEKSAFKNNHVISDLKNLLEIETFAGGNYFKIIKN